jgi:glycosyltransferase involved in cell wall biosynthesis
MRVVQVHNFYRSSAPSGEDEVVRTERALLRANDVEVIEFERHNDALDDGIGGGLRASLTNVWSDSARRDLAGVLDRHRPDVVHFHNTFPQISVAGYAACTDAGIPVIQTLHNFRLFCANGILSRDGKPCEDCILRGPLPGIVHSCYRDSRLATIGMSMSAMIHRPLRTHARLVRRFIALTHFARSKFVAAGLPAERIGVRGNSLEQDPGIGTGSGGYALFVGRLSAEKGLVTLIEAWRENPGIELRVVGEGPLDAEARERAAGLAVKFLGRQPQSEVARLMKDASMLVIPSIWYEGFPRVLVESLAAGTPVIASRLGSLAELVQDGREGYTFPAGDALALRSMVAKVAQDAGLLRQLRVHARARFEDQFSPQRAFDSLMQEYTAASAVH